MEHGDSTAVVSQVSHSMNKTSTVWQVESTFQWIVYRLDTLAPPREVRAQVLRNYRRITFSCLVGARVVLQNLWWEPNYPLYLHLLGMAFNRLSLDRLGQESLLTVVTVISSYSCSGGNHGGLTQRRRIYNTEYMVFSCKTP